MWTHRGRRRDWREGERKKRKAIENGHEASSSFAVCCGSHDNSPSKTRSPQLPHFCVVPVNPSNLHVLLYYSSFFLKREGQQHTPECGGLTNCPRLCPATQTDLDITDIIIIVTHSRSFINPPSVSPHDHFHCPALSLGLHLSLLTGPSALRQRSPIQQRLLQLDLAHLTQPRTACEWVLPLISLSPAPPSGILYSRRRDPWESGMPTDLVFVAWFPQLPRPWQ